MRRVWAGLVLAAWVGTAPAQSPPARPAAPQPAGDILIQKTAGQPERRLRLLRMDTGPDGERVADVQDLGTGARYTLPAAALAGMTRVAGGPTTSPTAAAPAKPAAPAGKFPTSLPLPEPTPGGHSPFVSRPLTQPPELRPRPQPAAPARPATPSGPVVPASLDTPLTALVAAPARPVEPVHPIEPPPLALPTPVPPPPMPAAEPVAPPPPPDVQPVRFQVSLPVIPSPSSAAPWQTTRAEQMRAEIEPYTNDLVNALRPSVRERAATALANCRHASQPEVKQFLARTAMTDPAPGVQAHCVGILAKLGYHDREYVEFLEVALGGESPVLRQAAAAALAKLAPR